MTAASPTAPPPPRGLFWWIALVLAAGTLVVYWPVTNYQFVNFDDTDFVTANPHVQAGLTSDSFKWAWHSEVARNWHPITMLTHMLDCQLYGLNAGGHHFDQCAAPRRQRRAPFSPAQAHDRRGLAQRLRGGALRLHPLHVESVAWIAERKDVLSTFFWFLTIWAYVRYVREVGKPNAKGKSFYAAALVFFALGLMSKPMLVTGPFVLAAPGLLAAWPRYCQPPRRNGRRRKRRRKCFRPASLGKDSVSGHEHRSLRHHLFHSATRRGDADRNTTCRWPRALKMP